VSASKPTPACACRPVAAAKQDVSAGLHSAGRRMREAGRGGAAPPIWPGKKWVKLVGRDGCQAAREWIGTQYCGCVCSFADCCQQCCCSAWHCVSLQQVSIKFTTGSFTGC
jgi:hypothetical protein